MGMKFIKYDKNLRQRARELRNHSTQAEIILWNYLRGRKLKGYKFNRQKPVHHYIVDFYCTELKLAIEVDGKIHDSQLEDDFRRQRELESFGVTFLRFKNEEIEKDLHTVLQTITKRISPLSGEGA
jgi:very-short-patch-repair endonuclease